MGIRGTLGVVLSAALLMAMSPPPIAKAVNLAVGMEIDAGKHSCSLGFFGFNARQDRLAVTAGHCVDGPDQKVYNSAGIVIGVVVARKADGVDAYGKMTGSRGYAVILLSKRLSLEPFFTGVGSIREGDWVTKYGQRTGKTQGQITKVVNNADRPDLAYVQSDTVVISGDSGSPWYTGPGAVLVGMTSSGNQERAGGANGHSAAQPIGDVLTMIRGGAGVWGEDFKVWIEG